MSTWKTVHFPVHATEEFDRFKRRVIRPADCVINALQILRIVYTKAADIMRIMVGEDGLSAKHIESIFDFVYPSRQHHFREVADYEFIEHLREMEYVENPSVVFAGIQFNTGEGHVFIIERSSMGGHYKIIDPQRPKLVHCGDDPEWVIQSCLPDRARLFLLQERIPRERKRSRSRVQLRVGSSSRSAKRLKYE